MTEAHTTSRRRSRLYLQSDFQTIKDAYTANACLFEEMNFEETDGKGWERMANSFVLENKRDPVTKELVLRNPKIAEFVKHIHDKKVEAERKICRRFDRMILNMRETRIKQFLSRDFSQKLKSMIRFKIDEEDLERLSKEIEQDEKNRESQLNNVINELSQLPPSKQSSTLPLKQIKSAAQRNSILIPA